MSTDLFSKQAELYSKYRPRYPRSLYDFILANCKDTDLAWDCATGNGQAAFDLSPHFKKIIATDISASQIQNAIHAENIEYQVLPAEQTLGVEDQSLDLITVAQALHWFDLDTFYKETKRLLKPSGVFAIWAYSFHAPIHPEIDSILNEFYFKTLSPFWKPNNKLIWDDYKSINFPFQEIHTPSLFMEVDWTLDDLIGYFQTWSATQLYIDKHKIDPTVQLKLTLLPRWPHPLEKKKLKWPLIFKMGINS